MLLNGVEGDATSRASSTH